jgi:membrane protein required for colicin V production
MNWLDIVLALILAASVARSFHKGLSREVIGLVSVVLALFLGTWFYATAGAFLLPYVSSPAAAHFAGFCLVFCAVMLLGGLVSFIVGKFLRVTGLSIVDHALGACFGLVRGIVVAIALIMGMMAFSMGDKPPVSVVNSRLAPYVVDAARFFASLAPLELRQGFRQSYAQVKEAWTNALDKGIRGVPSGKPNGKKDKNERQI